MNLAKGMVVRSKRRPNGGTYLIVNPAMPGIWRSYVECKKVSTGEKVQLHVDEVVPDEDNADSSQRLDPSRL